MSQPLNENPGRGSLPHLPSVQYQNQSVILFLTLCTKDRQRLLDRPVIHQLLREIWTDADAWLVGKYVILPDHIHLFCAPATFPALGIKSWVRYWKSMATRKWPLPRVKSIWQKDFFDRQLRLQESYREKWSYVIENPVRAGLVACAEDWPYQGELHVLQWHEP